MPSFFPTIYPDELLYSVLARYHVWSGNLSPKKTIEELFGIRTITAVADLPSHIDDLANTIQKVKRITSQQIILNNTLYPYYSTFLSEERATAVYERMKGNNKSNIHMMTGIIASSINPSDFLRYCPRCNIEDKEKYGEYYWHRLFQIPGVLICPFHNEPLHNSNINLNIQNRHEFLSANEDNCKSIVLGSRFGDEDMVRFLNLSQDICWINDNYHFARVKVASIDPLEDYYISLLKEKGYATANGRVYQKRLINDFIQFIGGNRFLQELNSELNDDDECNWLSEIVRKHRKSFHPLRHLLFIHFIKGSAKEFFCDINEFKPFGKGPWPCLNPAAEHYEKHIIKDVNISHSSDLKRPIGTFVCSCGFVYTRSGPDKTLSDIYKKGRIKCFDPFWEEKLRELVEKQELGLRRIARELKVDTNTVISYSKKLGLETKWKRTCAQTSKVKGDFCDNMPQDLDYNLFESHRRAWSCLVETKPNLSKTELREFDKAKYIWLYRHDNEWLKNNSPTKRKQRSINKRINWEERDLEIQKKIEVYINNNDEDESKPVRLTICRLVYCIIEI